MARHEVEVEVLGPWSLTTSRTFWEGFAPAALAPRAGAQQLSTVFCVERDWRRAEVVVAQAGGTARVVVTGRGPRRCHDAGVPLPLVGRRRPRVARRRQARRGGRRRAGPAAGPATVRLPLPVRGPRLGRSCPSGSASYRPPGCATTSSLDMATAARSRHQRRCALSTSDCRAARPSTSEPSPRLRSRGGSTAGHCALSTRTRPSGSCKRSKASDRSVPNSSSSAARTHQTRFPDTSAGWRPKSSSATAPTVRLPRCPRPGDRSAPGRPCTWAAVHLRALRERRTHEFSRRGPAPKG